MQRGLVFALVLCAWGSSSIDASGLRTPAEERPVCESTVGSEELPVIPSPLSAAGLVT